MNPVMPLAGGAGVVVVTPIAAMVFLGGGSTAVQADSCAAAVARASSGSLSTEQSANATTIVDVGEQMAVPSYGQVIAVAVALQESDLRDLDYGDADSLGLFQQRPSQGWGSPAQILDADYAATAFYHHLLAVPGWESMPLAEAAQAVQRSAFPDAYAKWQARATSIVQQLSAAAALRALRDPSAATLRPLGPSVRLSRPALVPLSSTSQAPPPAARTSQQTCGVVTLPSGSVGGVLSFAAAQVGKAYVLGATGPNDWDCSALVQAAYAAAGLALPRTADEQYDYARANGQILTGPPTIANLQPGDLLFSPGDDPIPAADGQPIGHVAIYVGNGVVIEAKGARWGVISTTYTTAEFGYVTFVGRLIEPPSPAAPTVVPSSPGAASASG